MGAILPDIAEADEVTLAAVASWSATFRPRFRPSIERGTASLGLSMQAGRIAAPSHGSLKGFEERQSVRSDKGLAHEHARRLQGRRTDSNLRSGEFDVPHQGRKIVAGDLGV